MTSFRSLKRSQLLNFPARSNRVVESLGEWMRVDVGTLCWWWELRWYLFIHGESGYCFIIQEVIGLWNHWANEIWWRYLLWGSSLLMKWRFEVIVCNWGPNNKSGCSYSCYCRLRTWQSYTRFCVLQGRFHLDDAFCG
jgi:hypothetical protein